MLEIIKCEYKIVNRTKDMYAYSWKIGHTKAPPPCMHRADRPSVPKTLPCITRIWLDGQRLYLEIAYPQKPTARPNAASPICEALTIWIEVECHTKHAADLRSFSFIIIIIIIIVGKIAIPSIKRPLLCYSVNGL